MTNDQYQHATARKSEDKAAGAMLQPAFFSRFAGLGVAENNVNVNVGRY